MMSRNFILIGVASLLIGLVLMNQVHAQEFVMRSNYKQMLEPNNQVMHGVGQSQDAHLKYWNVMSETQKPSVTMYYVGLKGISASWSASLKSEVLSYLPNFVIPQIGLSMTQDGTPSAHYEDKVAAGLMDTEIDALVAGLRSLACPVYLRIGFEFNGTGWNGYIAASYKQAFIRITQKIRAAGLEVATVWDASVGGSSNYMSFYPGDEVVDWWGINPFSVADLSHTTLKNFLSDAQLHKKPVMFGESTPLKVGVLQGETSWTNWFVPYFNLIHTNPGLKMFCYINWNWANYPQWADWGDCRLEMNSIVANHYNNEMKSATYLHSLGEKGFRSTLNYEDQIAPPQVQNLKLNETGQSSLVWEPVADPSGLSHYIIYSDNQITDYTLETQYPLYTLYAGQRASFSISAMDRAGNESLRSAPLVIQIPSEMEKLRNGNFENGLTDWAGEVWGGAATFEVEQSSPLSGTKSAHIKLTNSSGTNWHIQLRQGLKTRKGFTYRITYQARASKNLNMETWLQMGHDPYGMYTSATVNLTTQVKSFSQQTKINADDQVFLEFALGSAGIGEVWIDNVSVVEVNPNGTSAINTIEQSDRGVICLKQNFPNPVTATTSIEFELFSPEQLTMKLSNSYGQQVGCLANQYFTAGKHILNWDASNFPNGMYYYTIQSTKTSCETKKMIVQHR
jgi:hypothetical protein